MPETAEAKVLERPEPRERVQDALVEITALLRRHRLVEGLVHESLISSMDTEELVAAAETLDAEEIADLAPDLPQEVMDDVFSGLALEEREQLRAAMSFEDDMVGALMDFEDLQVRPDVTLEVVLRYLRRFEELPSQTDQLFVVDRDEKLLGVLPVNRLIVNEPDVLQELH